MSTATPPKAPAVNVIGLPRDAYRGGESTLCNGCGHDSISAQIIAVCYELGILPQSIAKFSGIGCSSKTPAYFLNRAHGFNGVHGRMPAYATGAIVANPTLRGIGISGDGDTGSIGLGQYKHMLRRNLPLVYIIANNGVYGLTKGQFSATADLGQTIKHAGTNDMPPIDLCLEALIGGAGFIGRSFAGDAKQVRALLKAAFSHRGIAVLDIISPCVTFNNAEDSTKSYPYGKSHEEPLHDISFVPFQPEITIEDYAPGTVREVKMHDGSVIVLKKIGNDYDPTDRNAAFNLLETSQAERTFATGLIYIDGRRPSLVEHEHMDPTPLVHLPPEKLRPTRESLAKVCATFK